MDTGYEMEPERIGRTRSRRVAAIVGAVALALVVTIVKPWTAANVAPVRPVLDRAAAASSSASHDATAPEPPTVFEPRWPVSTSSAIGPTLASTAAAAAVEPLEAHRGTWGVGVTGIGPRLLRDEPWSDWAAIEPEVLAGADATNGLPRHVMIWPGSGLCPDVPAIYDHPSVVSLTMPAPIRDDATFAGWWTDGGRTASIDDSVRLISIDDTAGMAAIERLDSAPWPDGLYEFQVRAHDRTYDLTVCLTRRD